MHSKPSCMIYLQPNIMCKSRAHIIVPLKIITEAINKLRKTDKPTIQHAFIIMMTLGRQTKHYAAKLAH